MPEVYEGTKFITKYNNDKLSDEVKKSDTFKRLMYWCNMFSKKKFANDGYSGNLSYRDSRTKNIIITKTHFNTDSFTEDDFVEVIDIDKKNNEVIVNGSYEPSSEIHMHNELYEYRGDIQAVFHGHSDVMLEGSKLLGWPTTKEEMDYGTQEVGIEVAKTIGYNYIGIINNHGFVVTGQMIDLAGRSTEKYYEEILNRLNPDN